MNYSTPVDQSDYSIGAVVYNNNYYNTALVRNGMRGVEVLEGERDKDKEVW